jgi:hypothetical protein
MKPATRFSVTATVGIAPALVLACGACVNLPDFARPSEIDRPRVLAVLAEPPEVNPGQAVQFSVAIAGVEDYGVTWRACGAFDGLFGEGSQWGEGGDDEGCGGGAFALELGEGDTAMLAGAATQALFDNLELAERVLGGTLPPDTIDHIRNSVGLPFTVEATVRTEARLIRAVKRVLISARETPHSNPPPPAFMVDDIEVRALGAEPDPDSDPDSDSEPDPEPDPDSEPEADSEPDPESDPESESDAGPDPEPASDPDIRPRPPALFTCRPVDGAPLVLPRNSDVELSPIVAGDGEIEPWLESYDVIDMRGELQPRDEIAFYSWFSTGGELSEGVTKAPLRNEVWRTPRAAGCHSLWLVVRDGHGGASACRLDVAVGRASCD